MKGRLSPIIRKILRDPAAKLELRKLLLSGKSGNVFLNGKRYFIHRRKRAAPSY